ncbi:MAG: hypothetical protein VKL39_24460 [Leptolyngbyaceae bacterium]|nr:hypothetical protein [Leptolyngbyaceae bacterium]
MVNANLINEDAISPSRLQMARWLCFDTESFIKAIRYKGETPFIFELSWIEKGKREILEINPEESDDFFDKKGNFVLPKSVPFNSSTWLRCLDAPQSTLNPTKEFTLIVVISTAEGA